VFGKLREQLALTPAPSAKVWIAMGLCCLVFAWTGYRLLDRQGLLIGFFSAMSLNALVFFYDDWRIAKLFDYQELEGGDAWGLLRLSHEIAKRLALKPAPVIRVLNLDSPCAYSVGLFSAKAKIYISEGLINRLSHKELIGVLTYEMTRIQNHQTQATTAFAGTAGLVSIAANFLDTIVVATQWGRSSRLKKSGPFAFLTSPLIALLARFGVRRPSVFEADTFVAASLGKGEEGASGNEEWALALMKLDSYSKTLPLDVGLADAALFTVNPLARLPRFAFASVQPSIPERIKKLVGHYPL
jgi:heat shock protein HtpX